MIFTTKHSKKTRDIAILVLTVLVLGFLLNLLASIAFESYFKQMEQLRLTLLLTIIVTTSAYLATRLLKPPNTITKVASCELIWDLKNGRIFESVYDYSGYSPQMYAFQMFEKMEQHKRELTEGLKEGIGLPPNKKHVISHLMDYLVLFWLGYDALKPTYKEGFKGRSLSLRDLPHVLKNNPVIALAQDLAMHNPGWMPPDITMELPEGTDVSWSEVNERADPNAGKIVLENNYFTIGITYHVSGFTRVSSMWMGPAPSMMGMPINRFFLGKECDEKRRLNPSLVWVMSYYMVFHARFKEQRLARPRTFYRYMRWAEQLSELFVDFFDWNRNVQKALTSRQSELYEILKGLELRLEDIENKLSKSFSHKEADS